MKINFNPKTIKKNICLIKWHPDMTGSIISCHLEHREKSYLTEENYPCEFSS